MYRVIYSWYGIIIPLSSQVLGIIYYQGLIDPKVYEPLVLFNNFALDWPMMALIEEVYCTN